MLPDIMRLCEYTALMCLNAPTGARCSLTSKYGDAEEFINGSQCTYRCAVLPDLEWKRLKGAVMNVSMHLQVRGAP